MLRDSRTTQAEDSRFKVWLRWVGYALLALAIVVPFAFISWDRGRRSASAPAVIRTIWPQSGGRVMVGEFSFTVDGHVYRGEDEESPRAGRGDRTWSRGELEGMHVCYEAARPGENFALAPARYRCGDPEIFTTDGGW